MPKQEKNVRRAAVSALRAWSKGHDYAESVIEKHAVRNNLSGSDRALLQAILMAVLRHRNLIDHWIGKIRRGKLDHEVRDILRVGVAQLMILRIPDHAAVYETVNCGRTPARGLINAVLRKTLLLRKRFLEDLENDPLPIQYSTPEWLWKRWRKQFGLNKTVALAEWNNEPAENYLRLNPLKGGDSESIEGLQPTEDERFFKIEGSFPHEAVAAGEVYVQDFATRHAVDLMGVKPGEVVLDACAAPGGKAAFLAAQMENRGELLCTDSNEKRLPRLSENLERLGVNIAEVVCHDWTQPAPKEWHGKFDAILADVPCSNTGVIRRRVDVKWRLKHEQFSELIELQKLIVSHLLPCLTENGRMVYSTCSIDQEENSDVVSHVVEQNDNVELIEEKQIYPFEHGSDGAYAALLRRK